MGADQFTDEDVEAAARMIASENPSAGPDVWVEQIWSQIRSLRPKQSLYLRITGGAGYGSQGGRRPVSTAKPATDAHRQIAREVLTGRRPSRLEGARKYFDPGQQDAVMRQVEAGRAALARGEEISERTQQLIAAGYQRDAQGVRDKWAGEGSHPIGTVGPVEFWS